MAAMKVHCYMRTLQQAGAGGRGPSADCRLLLTALQSAVSYMFTLVKARTSAAEQRNRMECR